MSAREDIAINLQNQLQNMTNPAPGLVSRVYFDVVKIAITQFPAILINTLNDFRQDVAMGLRQSIVDYQLRCYVRGSQIDTLRNELLERIEETIEVSRNRDVAANSENIHNVTSKITGVQVIERELPLGEIVINVQVTYRYKRGVV